MPDLVEQVRRTRQAWPQGLCLQLERASVGNMPPGRRQGSCRCHLLVWRSVQPVSCKRRPSQRAATRARRHPRARRGRFAATGVTGSRRQCLHAGAGGAGSGMLLTRGIGKGGVVDLSPRRLAVAKWRMRASSWRRRWLTLLRPSVCIACSGQRPLFLSRPLLQRPNTLEAPCRSAEMALANLRTALKKLYSLYRLLKQVRLWSVRLCPAIQ